MALIIGSNFLKSCRGHLRAAGKFAENRSHSEEQEKG
jgi:hypothetical protein